MAKKAYVGVDGVARRAKKIYVGVDGTARKVKKGYIGVDGVARLFYNSVGVLQYHGFVTPLKTARAYMSNARNADYTIFAGGGHILYEYATTNAVDAFNSSLTRTNPSGLRGDEGTSMCGATAGEYALFAGGEWRLLDEEGGAYGEDTDYVTAYSKTLTRSFPSTLPAACTALSGTSIAGYALFAGGYYAGSRKKTVTAYDASLTQRFPTELTIALNGVGAASIPDHYALFAGGLAKNDTQTTSSRSNVVHAYNSSLTQTIATPLPKMISAMGGASVGRYALFGGGTAYSATASLKQTSNTTMYAYDDSLTQTVATNSLNWSNGMITETEGYALFGRMVYGTQPPVVFAYDESLTTTQFTLTKSTYGCVAGAIGDYVLFAGGEFAPDASSELQNSIEALKLV